jgi:hypothetical protein
VRAVSRRVTGDPVRLEAYTDTTAPTVAPTLAGVDDYAAALHTFLRAAPNDLCGPVLADRSPGLERLLEELQVLDDAPAAFAAALRVLDQRFSCDPTVDGRRSVRDDELLRAAIAARLIDPTTTMGDYAAQVAQLRDDQAAGDVWRNLGALGGGVLAADSARGSVQQLTRSVVNGRSAPARG